MKVNDVINVSISHLHNLNDKLKQFFCSMFSFVWNFLRNHITFPILLICSRLISFFAFLIFGIFISAVSFRSSRENKNINFSKNKSTTIIKATACVFKEHVSMYREITVYMWLWSTEYDLPRAGNIKRLPA